MRLCKPSFEILEQQCGLEGVYKQIELAGRTCYKSYDKITEDSAKEFVDRMIKSGHGAMLEHGTVYLHIPNDDINRNFYYSRYRRNQYSKCNYFENIHGKPSMNLCITTNMRVLIENGWLNDLQYLCKPTEYHAKRVTIKFICDNGVAREFCRHRVFSFAQESTRYCNYSKNKFGNELTFIQPCWGMSHTGNYHGIDNFDGDYYEHNLRDAEQYYFKLLELGWKPQQARNVLPLALKTELVMTGFVSDWKHFFELRDANSAHPQAKELAHPLHMEFLSRGYLVDLYDEANPD